MRTVISSSDISFVKTGLQAKGINYNYNTYNKETIACTYYFVVIPFK